MPVLENLKHESFAQAIAEGSSATKAYREHVAEEGATTETCMRNASRLMADAKVVPRVAELRRAFAEVLEEGLGVRRETLARYLVSIMETPIGEIREGHELCQEYSETPGPNGTSFKYKMPSKLDAVEKLIKMAGWYAPERIEHSGGNGLAGMFAELCGVQPK